MSDFPIRHTMLPLLMLTMEVYQKVSPYIIWKVIGTHAGEIWTKSYGPNYTKFWTFWQKMVNNFWQSVDVILEDVSATETIVWY